MGPANPALFVEDIVRTISMPFRAALCACTMLACLTGWPPAAAANLDLCNDVLRQDIFNRTVDASQAAQSAKNAYLDSFFESDTESAYEEYKKAYSEQHNSSTKVNAEFHYAVIGGELDLSFEHGAAMSKEDFSKQFSEKKAQRQRNASGSSESASSLISNYQSAIRDPNTIEAWRQCMLSRTSDPSLVAYGYRDASDNAYLTVMWIPGRALASISPEVELNFVSPDPDVVVAASQGGVFSRLLGSNTVKLASGSGAGFALRFKTPNARARYQGFAILINATARDGRRHLMDFHEQAIVPSAMGEVPCDLLIQPGREYEYVTYTNGLTPDQVALFKGMMVLRVQSALPAGGQSGRDYDAALNFTPKAIERARVMPTVATGAEGLAERNKRMENFMRTIKLRITTDGSTLTLHSTNRNGTPASDAVGHCTVDEAHGSSQSRFPTYFNISAKR